MTRTDYANRAQPRIRLSAVTGYAVGQILGNGITAAVFALALYRWLA